MGGLAQRHMTRCASFVFILAALVGGVLSGVRLARRHESAKPTTCGGSKTPVCITGYEPIAANGLKIGLKNMKPDVYGLANLKSNKRIGKPLVRDPTCFPIVPYESRSVLSFNTCESCSNPSDKSRTYPDKHGCAICPKGEYPLLHRIGGTAVINEKYSYGSVECAKPNAGTKQFCYPLYTANALQLPGIKLPESCITLGPVRMDLRQGKNWNQFNQWMVGCLVWKHVFCADVWDADKKKTTRSCATTKQVKWLYVDNCPDILGEPGRELNFDYEKCTSDGCPSSCRKRFTEAGAKITKYQVITDSKKLPTDLRDYDDTYGLCSRAATTS